jgi:PAS domain S-box-containing protein
VTVVLSLQDYQDLVDHAALMIWRTDASGRCDYLDPRARAFTQGALQDGGDGWATGIHPEDLERCLALFRAHHAARTPFELVYRLRRGDGTYRTILDRGGPRRDAAGAFAGFVGSRVDVSDRLAAEELEAARRGPGRARALLPICVSCKRVRDERGCWHRVERYLEERGDAAFTHTFCESCERAVE